MFALTQLSEAEKKENSLIIQSRPEFEEQNSVIWQSLSQIFPVTMGIIYPTSTAGSLYHIFFLYWPATANTTDIKKNQCSRNILEKGKFKYNKDKTEQTNVSGRL